jgi:glycosyltransferase involved in cell wall biosynthesis
MLDTTDDRKSTLEALEKEIAEHRRFDFPEGTRLVATGPTAKARKRRPAEPPPVTDEGPPPEEVPPQDTARVLALFCFDDPASDIGQWVARIGSALARKQIAVHIFSRKAFELDAAGLSIHVVGECPGDDLHAQVQEFTNRACNAFLQHFEGRFARIILLGCEWSALPALSLLHGIKQLDILWSLNSLERQRSDVSSDLSKQIEEIELRGLREAKSILVHDPATAEIAKYWVPECADRLVTARQPFPVASFDSNFDAGAIKARYQVGPVDPTILYLGDLSEQYGPDLLVKAMPGVLKNTNQARLIVVGDGGLYWPLRVFTRYLLLEHAVRLVGHVEGRALQELIQAADLIVVPSRESTPWWPIQAAWAAKRPLVATHPAAPGLVEHEQDGVLCYPSENSLVWGIERILFDAELRRTIGQKGHDKLDERFGWVIAAAQVEELLGVVQAR